jgi:hypothetical protein
MGVSKGFMHQQWVILLLYKFIHIFLNSSLSRFKLTFVGQ